MKPPNSKPGEESLMELRTAAIDKAYPDEEEQENGSDDKSEEVEKDLDAKLKESPPTSRTELEQILSACGYKLVEDGEK